MVQFELCNRSWFYAGRDAPESDYAVRAIYAAKQVFMNALLSIECKASISELEKALKSIDVDPTHFDGNPYISGNDVFVSTRSMPCACPVGRIIK